MPKFKVGDEVYNKHRDCSRRIIDVTNRHYSFLVTKMGSYRSNFVGDKFVMPIADVDKDYELIGDPIENFVRQRLSEMGIIINA